MLTTDNGALQLWLDIESVALARAVKDLAVQMPEWMVIMDTLSASQPPQCWVTDKEQPHIPEAFQHVSCFQLIKETATRYSPQAFVTALHNATPVMEPVIEWGDVSFKPLQRVLEYQQTHIHLTEKESDMLALLARAKSAVPMQRLLEEVWHYRSEVNSTTLQTHIYRLRKKCRDAKLPLYIVVEGSEISLEIQNTAL